MTSIGERLEQLNHRKERSATVLAHSQKTPFARFQRFENSLSANIAKFNETAENSKKELELNPWSESYTRPNFKQTDEGYGRPPPGSKTEKRGIKAGNHIGNEMIELCGWISEIGEERSDGTKIITFGKLFQLYTKISNKVVGMLIRARKYNLVAFKGEMLYQGQDDHKVITLLKPMEEIRELCTESGDPKSCMKLN